MFKWCSVAVFALAALSLGNHSVSREHVTGKPEIVVQAGHPAAIVTVAATHVGSSWYVTGGQDGTVRVVAQNGDLLRRIRICDYWIHGIEFLSEETIAVHCGDHNRYIVDALRGAVLESAPAGRPPPWNQRKTSDSISGRTSHINVNKFRQTSFVVEHSGGRTQQFRTPRTSLRVDSLVWTSNGFLVMGMEGGQVQIWNTITGVPVHSVAAHQGPVHSVNTYGNGALIVSGGFDDGIREYEFLSDRVSEVWHVKPDLRDKVPTRDEWDRILYIDREDIDPVVRPRAPFGLTIDNEPVNVNELYRLAFSSDGKYVVATGRGVAQFIHRDSSVSKRLIDSQSLGTKEVKSAAFSHDNKLLALLLNDRVLVFSVGSLQLLRELKVDYRMRTLAFTGGNNPRLFVAGGAGRIDSWNTSSWAATSLAYQPAVSRLAYWPAGDLLAAAGPSSDIGLIPLSGDTGQSLVGHTSSVTALAFHPNEPLLASSGSDGSVNFWNLETRQLLATLVPASVSDWVVADRDGFFDGPTASWQRVRFRVAQSMLSPEQLARQYWEPGLLQQVLSEQKPITEILDSGVAADRFADLASLINSKAPMVDLKTASPPGQREQVISVQASDRGSGAVDLRVFRNGSLVYKQDGPLPAKIEAKVVLVAGTNDLTAYAFSKEGVRSTIAKVSAVGPRESPVVPTTHVLAVGIDDYQTQPLKYAVADANAVAVGFADLHPPGFAFRQKTLPDGEATRDEIRKELLSIASVAEPEDFVVVYFAGHGVRLDNRLHLLPFDYSLDANGDTPLKTISDKDLQEWLEPLKASRILLVIDACHAGQALEGGDTRWGPFNSRGLGQLAFEKGIYVVGASQGYQSALENAELGHGLLTYAFIKEGLERMSADHMPADGRLFAEELLTFVATRVPELQIESARRRGLMAPPALQNIDPDEAWLQVPRIYYSPEFEQNPFLLRRRN